MPRCKGLAARRPGAQLSMSWRASCVVAFLTIALLLNEHCLAQVEAAAVPKVVVVGGGLAGLSAALQVAEEAGNDVEVVLLEKQPKLGGNSAKASSGINALTETAGDKVQLFVNDTLVSGGGRSRPELVERLVGNSDSALQFLTSHGVQLGKLTQLGGHSTKRTHSNAAGPNIGNVIISQLAKAVQDMPQITVITSAQAKSLLKTGSGASVRVGGVAYHASESSGGGAGDADTPATAVSADVVIMTTGGFGANRDMLRTHNPSVDGFATTNGQWATGDGIGMGHAVGGQLVDMDQVQVHPTGLVNPKDPDADTKFLAPERLRGVGGVLLNSTGKRFVNELGRRDYVTGEMLRQEGKTAWLLLGSTQADDFGTATLGFYAGKAGLAVKGDGVDEIAVAMGLDADALRAELAHYNSAMKNGTADEFGKTVFPNGAINLEEAMYAMQVTPVVHYTMGGLSIDEHAQVLDSAGVPIPGLLAAGEVTGGVHGANRLGGNSLLDCTVFGRIAGSQAVRHLEIAGLLPTADDRAEL
mmetsp:Transcript_24953/g.62796  ORF Transcript_24953/g.62796 Transcript_24953/m.62796 type:complete len:529 (-) Transcript_24953:219-1805(-)